MPGTSKIAYEGVYKELDRFLDEIAEAQGHVFGKGDPTKITKAQRDVISAHVQINTCTSEHIVGKCLNNYIITNRVIVVPALDHFELEKVRKAKEEKLAKGLLEKEEENILDATPDTAGRFDVDIITTGKARSMIERIETILDIIKEKTKEQDTVPVDEVLKASELSGLESKLTKKLLKELINKNEVYEVEPGWVALTGDRK